MTLPCVNCGKSVTVISVRPTGETFAIHDGCSRPTISLVCVNPVLIGRIDGITTPAPRVGWNVPADDPDAHIGATEAV